MKKILVLAILALSNIYSHAYNAVIDGIYYNFWEDNATVTSGGSTNSYSGVVVIPEAITYKDKTYCVTSIGESAFSYCTGLTSITIPNSVTSIGNSAFYNCSRLTSVTIPNSVTSIGNSAFYNCSRLTSVTIPNSVTSIGEQVFNGCSSLNAVTIPVEDLNFFCNNKIVSLIKKMIGKPIKLIGADGNEITNYIVPNSVTSIGDYAFNNCSGLTSITICDSVTSIGSSAFSGCTGLASVHITDLAAWCNITCENIESQPLYYAHHLFLNGQEIKDLVIPEYLTHIGDYAFCGCSGLTSVTIPENVTYLGAGSFYNCPRIKHIYVCSQMPADCGSNTTFYCKTGVRDGYDVYNYAILHVPMGSKEEYAAAYEWRYFVKIKEDLDINGQVFYTTLSINHAGDGYVKHYVKADEPYTLYIGSEEGMRINTVLFNGEDVTDCLVDGYYTTPNITRPSKIVVSFEQDPDGIESVSADDRLHVYGNDGSLYVSGIEEPQGVSVYSVNGMLVNSQTLDGDTKIKLNEGIYIVKVGERTFKVSL